MDAFSYLSVLLSIILGLALTQILQSYRALLLAQGRVRWSLLPLLWSAMLLLFVTQAWWASFGLRTHTVWGFATFTVILAQMALLYMMAALVLPDAPSGETIDLADHFDRHRRAFFLFLLATVAASVAKEFTLEGRLPLAGNLAFHILLATTAIIGATFANRTAQLMLAVVTLGGFVAYVALLFAQIN